MTSFSEITGVLDRAQNPDALLTDGSRQLTGNLAVTNGITVDGVDISAFHSAYIAHLGSPTAHGYVRNILDDASAAVDRDALTNDVRIYGASGISVTKTATGLRISGSGGGGGVSAFAGIKDPSGTAAVPDALNFISLSASNVFAITAGTNSLAFALVPGNINHQTLGGRGADDHHAAFVGLKVGATTIAPDANDVITLAAGTNASVATAGSTITFGVSATPTFTGLTVNGNIAVTGTVDGVDVSTHAANANAHHNQSHVLATNAGLGTDHTISGATAGHVLRASSATAAAFAAIQDADLPSTIVRTSRQIVSGAGLTGGGNLSADRTLAVGAGAGITVNADDVALTTPGSLSATSTNSASGSHTHAIDSTIARSAIQIIAGSGLTGGGNLTADRTLNVGAGNGISVAADSVAVNTAFDFTWTGDHVFTLHTEFDSADFDGAVNVYGDDLRVFNASDLTTPVLYVDVSTRSIGVNRDPDPQFDVDVAGALRAAWLVGPHAIQLSDAVLIAHYDGPGPYATNFTGTPQGHRGQVATVTGGVVYRPGKFGKSVQLAEATTNLCTNPSFETNTSNWVSSWGDTLSRSSEQAKYGSYSLKIAADGTTNGQGASRDTTVTAGQTYTVSCWVYVPSSYTGASPSPRIYDGANFTTALGAVAITQRDEWVYWSTTQTITSTTLRFLLYASANVAAGQAFYLDAVQVEQKTYATPYCDGALGNGHSWSGTAHASTSSRTYARLSYASPVSNPPLTVALWYYVDSASQIAGSPYYYTNLIWSSDDANNALNRFVIQYNPYTPAWIMRVSNGSGTETTISSGEGSLANGWHHFVATADTSGSIAIYIDGVLKASTTGANIPATMTGAMTVGSRLAGTGNADRGANGVVDDVFVLSRAASADEIRAIYESNAPVFAESAVAYYKSYGPTPVEINEDGLFVEGPTRGPILAVYGGSGTKSWGGQTLSEGDVMLGRDDTYILWDDSAGDWLLHNVNLSITSSGYAVSVSSGSTQYILATGNGYFYAGNSDTGGLTDANATLAVHPTGDVYIGSQSDGDYIKWDEANGRFVLNNAQLRVVGTGGVEHWNGSDQTFLIGQNALNVGNMSSGALTDSNSMLVVNQTYFQVGGGALLYDSSDLDFYKALSLKELGSAPPNPENGSELRVYMKADKYIIAYNHGGTMKYRYLDLTSTNATWTYTTTAP